MNKRKALLKITSLIQQQKAYYKTNCEVDADAVVQCENVCVPETLLVQETAVGTHPVSEGQLPGGMVSSEARPTIEQYRQTQEAFTETFKTKTYNLIKPESIHS